MNDYDRVIRILLVGDMGVGKTSIVERWVNQNWSPEYISTIGIDFKIAIRCVKDQKIKIQLYDTSGQDRFHSITRSYYRGANGIVIVYDIDNPSSLYHVSKWYRLIQESCGLEIPIFVIGNKSDLNSIIPELSIPGPHYRISAKSGDQAEDILTLILEKVLENTKSPPTSSNIILKKESLSRKGCCGV